MNCLFCNKDYLSKRKNSKFCSISCSNSFRKQQKITKTCNNCGNIFEIEYVHRNKKRKFCSYSCSSKHNWDVSQSQKEKIKKKFSDSAKNKFLNGFVHGMMGKNHSNDTKEKISEKLKKRYNKISKIGKPHTLDSKEKISASNKGKKAWNLGKQHSKETKEKISKITAERILNKKSFYSKGNYFSTKMNTVLYFRSSWEEKMFKYLDKEEEVINFVSEPFFIEYILGKQKKHYIPDLYVEYKDGRKILFEIKPKYFFDYKINQIKWAAAQEYCLKNNLMFVILSECELLKMGIL